MFEDLLEEARHADERRRDTIVRELASHPDDTLEAVIKVLNRPMKAHWRTAVQVIHTIGYPRNAKAIPTLIAHVGDQNSLAWDEAVQALVDMGAEAVVPYLIESLWEKKDHQYWGADVEGICSMLCLVDGAFAFQCGPIIVYILGQDILTAPDALDKSFLLNVLEKIGAKCAEYALPTLVGLISKEASSPVAQQAIRLINSFDERMLGPYQMLLISLFGRKS